MVLFVSKGCDNLNRSTEVACVKGCSLKKVFQQLMPFDYPSDKVYSLFKIENGISIQKQGQELFNISTITCIKAVNGYLVGGLQVSS